MSDPVGSSLQSNLDAAGAEGINNASRSARNWWIAFTVVAVVATVGGAMYDDRRRKKKRK